MKLTIREITAAALVSAAMTGMTAGSAEAATNLGLGLYGANGSQLSPGISASNAVLFDHHDKDKESCKGTEGCKGKESCKAKDGDKEGSEEGKDKGSCKGKDGCAAKK